MVGSWTIRVDGVAHTIKAELPFTISWSKHKLNVYLDGKIIYSTGTVIATKEVGRFKLYGHECVVRVKGFGHLGSIQLLIDGRDADEITELQDLDKLEHQKLDSSNSQKPTTRHVSKQSLRVFLCHASVDKQPVRELYKKLRSEGFNPWLDEEKLLPGQEWEQEIAKSVRTSDIVIVCLSQEAVNKRGFVQKEIKYALDVADEQPEGTIFIIPLKLEECEIPDRLRRWQWVMLSDKKGYKQLIDALRLRAEIISKK
jgi:TIR domain